MKLYGIFAVCAFLILTGCTSNSSSSSVQQSEVSSTQRERKLPTVNEIGGNKLVMEKYSMRLNLGEKDKLIISKLPEGFTAEDVLFLSDNPRSVVVDEDGTITARQSGASSIGVALAGTSTRATVTVIVGSGTGGSNESN